jgi:hypothetical protein
MSTAAINWIILSVVIFLIGLTVALAQLDARHGYCQKLSWIWEHQVKAGPWWAKSLTIVRVVSGIAAAGLFLASLTVNICTWVFRGISQYAHWLMCIHLGVLLLAAVSMAFTRKGGIRLPKWARVFMSALAIYFFVLLAFGSWHSSGKRDEGRVGENRSASSSQVQLEADSKNQSEEDLQALRTFSPLWMAFSFASATGLLLSRGENYKGPFGKYNSVVQ